MLCKNKIPLSSTEIFISFITIISAITILFITTLLTYIIYNKSKLQTCSNYIILMLFWSDTTSAFVISLVRLKFQLCKEFTYSNCLGVICLTRVFSYISIGCLLFITFERFLKLLHRRIYHRFINKVYVLRGLLCHLILSFIMGIIIDTDWIGYSKSNLNEPIIYCTYETVLNPTYGFINTLFVQIVTIIIIVILYITLIIFVRNQTMSNNLNEQTHHNHKNIKRINAEFKIAISAMAIVGCYCFFVFPIISIDLIKFGNKINNKKSKLNPNFLLYAICCGILYPGVEGIVFILTSKQFWKPIGNIFHIKALIQMVTMSEYTTSVTNRTFRRNNNLINRTSTL